MKVTHRQLNRSTLERQLLLDRKPIGVVGALRQVVALQAQEPASPYLALWNRIAGFDPAHLDDAFAERAIVKATLMRVTLHAVVADEYTTFHEAMVRILRASRLYDNRYTSMGLTIADAEAALKVVVPFAARPRTRAEINELLSELGGSPAEPRLWWALRTFAPLTHAPNGAPWSFDREQAFEAAPTAPPRTAPDEALQRLIWRYLEGFGPASAQDFAQFAMQRQSEIGPALGALADHLTVIEGPDGQTLLDVPGMALPSEDTPAPARLLGMWDNILLAYRDRSRVIPDVHRSVVIRRNGDVLPTVLVDGYVSGVWRPVNGAIEVLAFRDLPDSEWEAIAHEGRKLGALIASRDPTTYGRYANWWKKLPEGEVRTFE